MSKRFTPPEFVAALQRSRDAVKQDGYGKAVLAGAYVVETHAKLNVRDTFKQGGGDLMNSIQSSLVSASAMRAEAETGPTVIYGRIQEQGGTVVPVNAKMLHWVDEAGKHHSAFSVTLPARPYMEPAVNDHEDEILNAMGTTLMNIIEGAI